MSLRLCNCCQFGEFADPCVSPHVNVSNCSITLSMGRFSRLMASTEIVKADVFVLSGILSFHGWNTVYLSKPHFVFTVAYLLLTAPRQVQAVK